MVKKRKKTPTTLLNYPLEVSARDIVGIVCQFDFDDVVKIIAAIDAQCQDWGVTKKLVNHFLYLKDIGEKELNDGEVRFFPEKIDNEFQYSEMDLAISDAFEKNEKKQKDANQYA